MKTITYLVSYTLFLAFSTVTLAGEGGESEKLTNSNNPYAVKTVVIDAGHGGKDGGCVGKTTTEKDIALNIALKVGAYIESRLPDVKVIYTRKKDVFIELHERADIANRNKADLFMSIHCNAMPRRGKTNGTETYIMGLAKAKENLAVARRENAVIQYESNYEDNYDGFNPNNPESHIIFSLYQNAYLAQSLKFAALVESQFKHRAKRKSRGVKQQNFLVLYKTTMPSVLIETGFLTNDLEESYLQTDDGQTYIASAIYRAFKAYKEEMEGKKSIEQLWTTEGVTQKAPIQSPKTSTAINSKVRYQVQLYTTYESADLGKPNFDAVHKVDIENGKDGTKYYMSSNAYSNYQHAEKHLLQIRQAGFKHARIIVYRNGIRQN